MEILFMVFMVVVSVMALFAVMVVFRDVTSEVLQSRKEREKTDRSIIKYAEKIIAEAEAAKAKEAVSSPVAVVEAPAVVETPVVEEIKEEPVAPVVEPEVVEESPIEEDSGDKISFSKGQQQTIDEKYMALSSEKRGWYDEIIKYASAVEGSKRVKNLRYEEYKVGNNRIVRMLIKRGVINCEFVLHNSDFKAYVDEKKINVKQSSTTMLIESAATVDAAKNSIDIVVAAIAEEKEYKKQLAKEKRKAARASAQETASK